MKGHSCTFSLKPRTDADGMVRVKTDHIVAGLVICLMGLLAGGIAIAASGIDGGSTNRPKHGREPFQAANSLYGKNIEDIDVTQFGFDAEPSKAATAVAMTDSHGVAGKSLNSLVMKHGVAVLFIIAALAGIRIMFTGITISIDPRKSRVQWIHKGSFRASSETYTFSRIHLVLHETVVWQSRDLDWHGFAASLTNSDNGAIQLARSKTIEGVRQYARNLERLTGIESKEIGQEQARSYGLFRWRPFSLRNG